MIIRRKRGQRIRNDRRTVPMTDPRQAPSGQFERQVVGALHRLVNAALPLQSREHLTRAELYHIRQALGLGIAAIQKLDVFDAAPVPRTARRRVGNEGASVRGAL